MQHDKHCKAVSQCHMGDTPEFRNHPNVNEHLEGEGRNNHWENS